MTKEKTTREEKYDKTNTPLPPFMYVKNPNSQKDGEPNRYLIENNGSSIHIKKVWR